MEQVGGVGQLGSYIFDANGEPVKITINSGGCEPRLSLLHEVGHFLDHAGIRPTGGFQSRCNNPLLGKWWDAIRQSKVFRRAEAMRRRKTMLVEVRPGKRERVIIDQEIVSDRLEPRELFARSYSQYVVLHAGAEALHKELRHALSGQNAVKYPEHWDEEDFVPIARALDDVMRSLGWRT